MAEDSLTKHQKLVTLRMKLLQKTGPYNMKIEKLECKEDLSKVMDQIFEENDREHGAELGFEAFAYALKNDNNEIVGGIYGWKAFSEIYIDELCISKENRGLGYGKKLLEIVGKEMNGKNDCANINLLTNSFQDAIEFYKKCGFEVEFIRRNTKDSKYDKYCMIKKL